MNTSFDWEAWRPTFEVGLPLALMAAIVVGAAAILFYLWRRVQRFRRLETRQPDLALDVGSLSETPPPTRGPQLELYHLPMRLAVVVLGPTGRAAVPPSDDEVPELLDHAVPGLASIVAAHQPLIVCWPTQLSAQGFARTFFAHVRLPGDRGKGTVWSSVAGRFEANGQRFQAGLVLCAATPNNLSQVLVQRETQWLDLLRIRSEQH